jgi:hypothetical protein
MEVNPRSSEEEQLSSAHPATDRRIEYQRITSDYLPYSIGISGEYRK